MNQPLAIPSEMQVLEQISHLPLKLNNTLYRHYPAMKLGQQSAIDFYSQSLAQLATNIHQQSEPAEWVITVPPCHFLPAAANLLAREVHRRFTSQGISLDLVEPKLRQQQAAFKNEAEFQRYYNYSKNNITQRIAERQRVQSALETRELDQQFKNKSLIIINDINVTGTQQHFMQQAFTRFNLRACYWLYIFNIETSLATNHPEIEHQINHSQVQSLESFQQILIDPQTNHTARCISRLFNETLDNFKLLIGTLTAEKRQHLYHLALQEGRYSNNIFEQKMQIFSHNGLTSKTPTSPEKSNMEV